MKQQYTVDWLIDEFNKDSVMEFLFFWSHTNKQNKEVGKFCFSQWFELPFTVDGIIYKTAEHWMMAHKALLFGDTRIYNEIINTHKSGAVKELGRQVSGFDEMIWKDHRYNIVVAGNIHKFNQHNKFADYLANTGNKILVEASPVDTIWGVGLGEDNENISDPNNWRGLNLLGFALMEARDFFKENDHFDDLQIKVRSPWKAYPDKHPADLFWRMGEGEDYMEKFTKYYSTLSVREKSIFKLTDLHPYAWKHFFDE